MNTAQAYRNHAMLHVFYLRPNPKRSRSHGENDSDDEVGTPGLVQTIRAFVAVFKYEPDSFK
jgi:hypothetical protein